MIIKKYFFKFVLFFQIKFIFCASSQDIISRNIFHWMSKNKLKVIVGVGFGIGSFLSLILYLLKKNNSHHKNNSNDVKKKNNEIPHEGASSNLYLVKNVESEDDEYIEIKNSHHLGTCSDEKNCISKNKNNDNCCDYHCTLLRDCKKDHRYCKGNGTIKINFNFLNPCIQKSTYLETVLEAFYMLNNRKICDENFFNSKFFYTCRCNTDIIENDKLESYQKIILEFFVFWKNINDDIMFFFRDDLEKCLKEKYINENWQLTSEGVQFIKNNKNSYMFDIPDFYEGIQCFFHHKYGVIIPASSYLHFICNNQDMNLSEKYDLSIKIVELIKTIQISCGDNHYTNSDDVDYKNCYFQKSFVFLNEKKDCIGFANIAVNYIDYDASTIFKTLNIKVPDDNGIIYIEKFGIFPWYQSKGYGQGALELLKKEYKDKKLFYLFSGSSRSLLENHKRQSRFYKKCGFVEYQLTDTNHIHSLYVYQPS